MFVAKTTQLISMQIIKWARKKYEQKNQLS